MNKITKAEEISVGPYILTGGELPAAVVVDAVARQIPNVLGKQESLEEKEECRGSPFTPSRKFLNIKAKIYRAENSSFRPSYKYKKLAGKTFQCYN